MEKVLVAQAAVDDLEEEKRASRERLKNRLGKNGT